VAGKQWYWHRETNLPLGLYERTLDIYSYSDVSPSLVEVKQFLKLEEITHSFQLQIQ